MRRASLCLAATCAALITASCGSEASDTDLVGSASLTLTRPGETVSVSFRGLTKFRADMRERDGGCAFHLEIRDGDTRLVLNTDHLESAPLLSGQGATFEARASKILDTKILNNATVYLDRDEGGGLGSEAGQVVVERLPDPVMPLRVRFVDVTMKTNNESWTLGGEVTATYIGVVGNPVGSESACPTLTRVPAGLVY